MRRLPLLILFCLLATLACASPADAGHNLQPPPPGRDPAKEQPIYDRLAKINAEAVPIFQEATRAMDAGDLAAAKRGYEQVLVLAPDFPDALRRMSYVEIRLGNVETGLQRARQAYAADNTPYNQIALAQALLATKDKSKATEALSLAKAAIKALSDDENANLILLQAGLVNDDIAVIRQASTTLVKVAPDNPNGHFFAGLIAAEDGNWEKAEQEILLSRQLGMPADLVQKALDSGIASQARLYRWLRWGAYAVVAWLGGMVVLFLLGALLSTLTLAAVRRQQDMAEFKVGAAERAVRILYAAVIALTSIYFYISIPLLILIVAAAAGGIFYIFVRIGRIPVKLALMIGLAALYTMYAVIRSVFTRVKEAEPGRPLTREEAPQLWALTEEVAQRVSTRPVDAVYVTPAAEIAVTERGSLLQKLRGIGQRCLILGLGALSDMTQGEFKAILAHEYGHFYNRDTAGGNLALQVRVSMHRMAYHLAANGLANWYNPAWLFVNGFYRIFLRITLGASRLQEILADRYAAVAYGVRNFTDGLLRIVRQSLAFDVQLGLEVEQAVSQRRLLHNLYTLPAVESGEQREKLEKSLDEVLSRPTSPYASHPAVQERIRLLQPLASTYSAWGDQETVWSLLPNADALQKEMTAIVQDNVNQHYAAVPAQP